MSAGTWGPERPGVRTPADTVAVAPDRRPRAKRNRPELRAVAVPTEHGGWGLTAEPVLLGLLVAPSIGGACLGVAAILAFLARTPLKVVLVDRHRGRTLPRTRLAAGVAAVEIAVLVALAAIAAATTQPGFWWPVVVIAPLVTVELWFDMRSRSRRLTPELSGAVGIAGIAAVILLAGGEAGAVAIGAWLVLAARATTAIVSVRDQVRQLHAKPANPRLVVAADLVAVTMVVLAALVSDQLILGAVSVFAAIAIARLLALKPPPRAVILGIRQTILGLAVVIATAIGIGWS